MITIGYVVNRREIVYITMQNLYDYIILNFYSPNWARNKLWPRTNNFESFSTTVDFPCVQMTRSESLIYFYFYLLVIIWSFFYYLSYLKYHKRLVIAILQNKLSICIACFEILLLEFFRSKTSESSRVFEVFSIIFWSEF